MSGSTDQARAERAALCDLFDEVGPEAPTLCEGWMTRDLAAHLVIREGRPDAAIGILGGPAAARTARIQDEVARTAWPELVEKVRTGPPAWSPFRLGEGLANLAEYVVHHEDVRRARPGWEPRSLAAADADRLWDRTRRMSKLMLRRVPAGISLARTDGTRETIQARPAPAGAGSVVLSGPAVEIMLRVFGRREVRLDVSGDKAAIDAFEAARLGI